ncbi:hypothetical protein JOC34_000496 [Virgibacillus halotolerans]|uniref:hypothetical protein n=1 Tax=Virgibacillus halotolerans TaxID=1071053 RepID=UPI00195FD96D|nr:hypothetical protein [Virgibacillus halotolerans]MBM7598139.1 hypothetical protein [Virgibacillus halotolerans]
MIELNERVEITQGYRTGDLAMVIYVDNDNNLCKVEFDDYEFYGYDISDIRSVYA